MAQPKVGAERKASMARRLRINTIGNLDPRSVRAAGILKRIAGLAAVLFVWGLLTPKPAAAQSMDYSDVYSGVTIDSYGYILGWGVTDVQYADSYHTAMVDTTLRSPNGRTSHMYAEDSNSARADVWMPYDANDLGFYSLESIHDAACVFVGWLVYHILTNGGAAQADIRLGGCGGTRITNSTQSAVAGQQITLCGLYEAPSGASVTSKSWTIGGTVVGGYNPTSAATSVTEATLNQQSTTIYWAYPGSSLQVKFKVNFSNGTSASPIATFNVTGPTGGTLASTAYGQVEVGDLSSGTGCSAGPYLVYAKNPHGPCTKTGMIVTQAGISFDVPANNSGGTFYLVQLINSDTGSGSYSFSKSGLDTQFPYDALIDAPSLGSMANWTSETWSFDAFMFLLWKYDTAPSIYVPLGYQRWKFDATATCSTNCGSASSWTVDPNTAGKVGGFETSNGSQGQITGTNVVLDHGFPTWLQLSQ
jgi:hypothetical protein